MEDLLEYIYTNFSFVESDQDKFLEMALKNTRNLTNEVSIKRRIKTNIYNYAINKINIDKNTFLPMIKDALKKLGPSKSFDFFDKVLSHVDNTLFMTFTCEISEIHELKPYFEKVITDNKITVDNNPIKNTLLNNVISLYLPKYEEKKMSYSDDFFTDNSFKLFLKDISNIKTPTSDENLKMLKEYAEAKTEEQQIELKKEISTRNIRLVISCAFLYKNYIKSLEILDLINEGSMGMYRAIENYDASLGFQFSTYATWWIRQAITRAINNQERTIRIPVHVIETYRTIDKAKTKLMTENCEEPTAEELANETGLKKEDVEELLSVTQITCSLDQKCQGGDDDANELIDFISSEDNNGLYFADISNNIDKVNDLYAAINTLPEDLRTIIEYSYGLSGKPNLTLVQIGKLIGLSHEGVRKKKKRALDILGIKLKKYLCDYSTDDQLKNIDLKTHKDLEDKVLTRRISEFNNFLEKLKNANSTLEVLSFDPSNFLIKVRCNKCEYEQSVKYQEIVKKNYQCIHCRKLEKIRFYQEQIDNENIEIVEYYNVKSPAKFRCNSCGCVWDESIYNLLRRNSCPQCARGRSRKRNKNIDGDDNE